jgi:hypothetical protein
MSCVKTQHNEGALDVTGNTPTLIPLRQRRPAPMPATRIAFAALAMTRLHEIGAARADTDPGPH